MTKPGSYRAGSEAPEHYVWRSMLQRAGKRHWRGVRVCERWIKYENFFEDMGPRPSPKHSLDRYPDASGDYVKSNCRWATPTQQMRNLRCTKFYSDGERTGTVGEWAAWLGISVPLARYRWRAWGTFSEGLSLKVKTNGGEWHSAPPPMAHKVNPRIKYYTDGVRTGTRMDWARWLGQTPACLHTRWKAWGTFEKGKAYANS